MRGAERTRHVPIIFVTRGSSSRSTCSAGRRGAVRFMFKTIDRRYCGTKESSFQLHRLAAEALAALCVQRRDSWPSRPRPSPIAERHPDDGGGEQPDASDEKTQ